MYEDLAEFAVKFASKNGASYVEARLEETNSNAFVLKNGGLEISGFEDSFGIGVRLINKNTLGFASTNIATKDALQDVIKKALDVTSASAKYSDNIKLSSEKPSKKSYKVYEKKNINDVSPKIKIDLLKNVDATLNKTGIKIPTGYYSLNDETVKKFYVNSEGSKIQSQIARPNFFYMFVVKDGTKTSQRMWQYGATGGWENVEKWDLPVRISKEAKDLYYALANGQSCPKGEVDIVASPQITGIISHESCGHPFEADRILGREAAQAGESFVTKELLNTKIGSNEVTVIDDPTIENSFGFYKYDDEGIKAKKRILIKNGIINELLQNRETAYTFNIKSNGSARATDYDKEPLIRMGNTILEKGSYKEEELFEGIKKGVYIKNFMEWNIDDKRFNQKYVGADAYLIENGKVTKPVLKPIIEITTPKLWSSVDAAANNTEYHAGSCGKGEPMQACPVWFGGPSMRIRKIKLG